MNGYPEPPRGERNHNPFNLEDEGIAWDGLADPPTDGAGYLVFVDDAHGLRAGFIDLHTAMTKDGLNTVGLLVPHFAPAADGNDVAAYEGDICQQLAVQPATPIDPNQPGNLAALGRAFIRHENGRCIYSASATATAVTQALAHANAQQGVQNQT